MQNLYKHIAMFSLFFWQLKLDAKEKSLLKLETTPNTEISGPPCAFLICFKTSRVNNFKYVLLFLFLFFAFINILLYILLVFFFFFLSYMANLFYYSMYLCCITVTYLFNINYYSNKNIKLKKSKMK